MQFSPCIILPIHFLNAPKGTVLLLILEFAVENSLQNPSNLHVALIMHVPYLQRTSLSDEALPFPPVKGKVQVSEDSRFVHGVELFPPHLFHHPYTESPDSRNF